VAWGIAAAAAISRARAALSAADSGRVLAVLGRLGPFAEPVRSPDDLRPLIARDKKSTARGIAGVLLERIGHARVEESIPEEEWLAAAAEATIP
jgi:3-dehydroquinate synthetase